MLRVPLFRALLTVLIVVIAASAHAQRAVSPGSLYDIVIPGGLHGAVQTLDDRVTPDRSQFLLEFIRRTHNRPLTIRNHQRDALVQALLAQFDRGRLSGATARETVPLPLPPALWVTHVFGGRATPETLLPAIVRSREAALLYTGLLSLDDSTRAWLEAEPSLITDIATRYAAAFMVAAPALRVNGATLILPGGEQARPAWEALVGRRSTDPSTFVRTLLARDEGRMAYFVSTFAELTAGQVRFALGLDAADAQARVGAVRRLYAVFGRVSTGWRVDDNAFWRPPIDPAFLAASLPMDPAGAPLLTGSRPFWSAVLPSADGYDQGSNGNGDASSDTRADFVWLCEQLFTGHRTEDRRRFDLVLFAARFVPRAKPAVEADVVAAVRAWYMYPALATAFDRTGVTDPRAFAAAARRATTIAAIEDDRRAARALAQFQGALVLLTRSAWRGGMAAGTLATDVSSLSAVELSGRGEYEGRLVRWLTAWLESHLARVPAATELDIVTAGAVERDTLIALAGPPDAEPRFVEWEGTRYRLDFSRAEAVRMTRLIGEEPRPFLTTARALVVMADAIAQSGVSGERLKSESAALGEIGASVGLDRPESWGESNISRQYTDAHTTLRRAAHATDARAAAKVAPILRGLADELLARGLKEAAYAAALGQPERSSISADEAAQRHDFGSGSPAIRGIAAWAPPLAGTMPGRGWHVSGSLLGLDLRLADFALLRLSSKMPIRRPSLEDDQRRILVETVALVNPLWLKDPDRDAIVSAMRKGRARLAAVRTPDDAAAIGDEIRLSPARRTLLIWATKNTPEMVTKFLSPLEWLWLGLGPTRLPDTFHPWGVSAHGRRGCACLEVIDRQPWEMLAGRWHSGILAGAFPDLNLRVAELLMDLQMPASLLAPVLASATLDLVENTPARDAGDRRALVDWVQSLRPERVEQYLALLTAGGPLVPVQSGGSR